jgi:hypothetical protein
MEAEIFRRFLHKNKYIKNVNYQQIIFWEILDFHIDGAESKYSGMLCGV